MRVHIILGVALAARLGDRAAEPAPQVVSLFVSVGWLLVVVGARLQTHVRNETTRLHASQGKRMVREFLLKSH
jgi:hypothetical protein